MTRIKLTEELLTEIREKVFGPCTVVYEAMNNAEIKQDICSYLAQNTVFFKGEKKAMYTPKLNLTTFKSWLIVRRDVEIMDAYPETPFDKTDDQIKREVKGRIELEGRLNTNIKNLVDKLRVTK